MVQRVQISGIMPEAVKLMVMASSREFGGVTGYTRIELNRIDCYYGH